MKRLTALFIGLLLVLCQLAACNAEHITDETEAFESTADITNTDNEGNDIIMPSTQQSFAEHIILKKSFGQQSEWNNEILLAVSEYSAAFLHEDSAQKYPTLANVLEQTKNMVVRSMEDEFDNLLSVARDELALLGAESFVTKSSTLDIQIRRADSMAVSLLSDSFMVNGNINDRYLNGTTYDSETGNQLTLTDVINDMSKIPAIVKRELTSHTWTGDFKSDTAVEDYFRDTPVDGISWTLDYNGVTFYFANGDIADIGRHGRLAATVSFEEHPELFNKKYMTIPEAYMVELPLAHPFCADLDGDGDFEEFNVTPVPDESGFGFVAFEIHYDTDAQYYRAEFSANTAHLTSGYHPYYIKTADSRHYLYVFAEGSELASSDMQLRVIDITDGKFREIGDMHIAPEYVPIDCTWALTDPDNMMLENFETKQETAAYCVGDDGMPARK